MYYFIGIVLLILACSNQKKSEKMQENQLTEGREIAILANGCFWCTEAVFTNLKGVQEVVPGFIGGTVKNPSYREVCTGKTGHAEALKITFDPAVISYEELLEVYFATHDPTTLNRQGDDVGTQYRSEIFYTTDEQRKWAEKAIQMLESEKIFDHPIVTKVSKATTFYEAEREHWNYYSQNKEQPYCRAVITPKVEKFKHLFKEKLKNEGI